MKTKVFLICWFLMNVVVSAQIKGVVKDSITGKPIPYVNISVQNENLGTTSEENGEFNIHISGKSKILVFSALGFEKKSVRIPNAAEVNLKPMAYQLEEIVISKRFETRQIEIGQTKNVTYEAFDNGPKIDTKFFPYLPSYKKTKFIKQVVISTDSKIDDAAFKIHFYGVDANGFPGDELLDRDFIVSVSKGVKKTTFNVTRFNLRIPKNGIFVGFEKLMIEKNKLEKTITDANTNNTHLQRTYFPFVLYNSIEREFQFTFSGGKWNKEIKTKDDDASIHTKVYEPAINLILTN